MNINNTIILERNEKNYQSPKKDNVWNKPLFLNYNNKTCEQINNNMYSELDIL